MKSSGKTVVTIICLGLLIAVAYLDLITPAELGLSFLYMIPISIAAWYSGRYSAILLCVIGAILWYFTDKLTGPHYIHQYLAWWNLALRCTSFLIIALAISQIRLMLDKEQSLKNELSLGFEKIKRFAVSAKKIAEGDFSVSVPVLEKDSKDHLDEAFNFMVQKLAEQKNMEEKLFRLERQSIIAETASFLAHEIRNPLNLIMLTAHYLGNQFSPKEEPQRTKFEELIISLKSEVDQLNKVITDFLSIGKSSELTKTNFKFSDTMKQINILIKQQLTLKNINVHTTGDNDCFICADEGQMHLVLLNLFVNAIAAAPVNGDIWVHARKNDAPLSFILTITDNGPGIVQNDIDKIFDPYFTKTPGGTGLGLSLVKRIIEDHNGSIKAENCPGKGAQFSITLPIEK